MSRVWDIIMSKHSLCKNKLDKRKERLIKKAILLTNQFQIFKDELDLELQDMQNMMAEINKSISNIDVVLTRPKRERSGLLAELYDIVH